MQRYMSEKKGKFRACAFFTVARSYQVALQLSLLNWSAKDNSFKLQKKSDGIPDTINLIARKIITQSQFYKKLLHFFLVIKFQGRSVDTPVAIHKPYLKHLYFRQSFAPFVGYNKTLNRQIYYERFQSMHFGQNWLLIRTEKCKKIHALFDLASAPNMRQETRLPQAAGEHIRGEMQTSKTKF